MYCGINCQPFQNIPSVNALLSAAEMLQSSHPSIAGSLINYASNLVANNISQADPNYQSLSQLASQSQIASAAELERFADALVASAQGNYSDDFYRLAYLIYGSISIQQPLPTRIMNKIRNAQQFVGSTTSMGAYNPYPPNIMQPPNSAPPNPYPAYPPNPNFLMSSQNIPSPTNLNGPPLFNPGQTSQNIPQTFTAGGPPSFTPPGQTTQNIPDFYASGPPPFNPSNQPASHPPHGFDPHPLSQSTSMAPSPVTLNSLKMTEMAQNALNSGNHNMAFSLLLGAILELQKPC